MFNTPLKITSDFSLPIDATDYQLNLALMHLRYPSCNKQLTSSGHIAFFTGSKNMTHDIHYALPADGFVRTPENLQQLKEETNLNFIWDPLNDPAQARLMADPTVILTPNTWDKNSLYGTWSALYPGGQLKAASLLESEICLELRHQGRDLRRVACEAFLMSHGWRSEIFLYLDRSRDLIRTIHLTRSQYSTICDHVPGGFLALHRRLIWFPSLAAYATRIGPEARQRIGAKEALCRKEATTRQLILDDELIQRLTSATGVYSGQLPGVKMP